MGIYLDEDQLGRDDDVVGFPHLLLCMGICLHTRQSMYGVHIVVNAARGNTIPSFAQYINQMNTLAQDMTGLYGCCNFKVRYGGNDAQGRWKAELTHVANQIGFTGPVRGFDTSIIDPKDGTYVEYVRNGNADKVKIFYKRNEKMDFSKSTASNPSVVRAGKNAPQILPVGKHTSDANINATEKNKGKLHEVSYTLRLKTFTV